MIRNLQAVVLLWLAMAALSFTTAGIPARAHPSAVSLDGDLRPLTDPTRPVTRIARDSFTLQYFTEEPCETRVQVREGELPMTAWGPGRTDPWREGAFRTVAGPAGKRTFHVVTAAGLKPGRRYFYRVYDPGVKPTRKEREWGAAPPWRREFAVSTQAARGYRTVIHLPVKVLLLPNVLNVASAHAPGEEAAPAPPKLAAAELARIREEYAATSRFFWVNSGMRLWVDFRIQVDDRWQRWGPEPEGAAPFYRGWPVCRSYAGVDFRGPGGGEFTILDTGDPLRVRKDPVLEARPYSGQIEQAFPRRWNAAAKKWEFYNSGGGTLGIDGFPRGIPARSQYLGGGDTAWLACHEFHHQLESHGAFSLSQREDDRIVFNHYEPRRRVLLPDGRTHETPWSTSGRHGEHWDGMAFWDRTLTDAQWLRMYFGYTLTVKDADGDGFPDDDPRLPLDEKRFGSSASRAATDGALGDLRKVMLSTWVPSCLQFSLTKPSSQAFRPDPRHPDSDRDGVPDGLDPYPLYPWAPFIWPRSAAVDGRADEWEGTAPAGVLEEGGVRAELRQAHDREGYYGLLKLSGPWQRLYVTLDGEGKGYFSGEGVLAFEALNESDVRVRPLRVPFLEEPAPGLTWKSSRAADGTTVLEFTIPNRRNSLWFWDGGGREIGVSLDLFARDGAGYSMYEPYRHFYARMLEPAGRPSLPAGAPAELTRETADRVLRPGDPALRVTGGWKLDGGLLKHSGNDESALYVEGLRAREFDLWVELEAKQDGILGAFLPGTERMGAGSDYIAFVGGYANTVTRFRLFGREEGDDDTRITPGRHRIQLTRRNGRVWCLFDGKPVLAAPDPHPDRVVDRLAVIGGYGGEQVVHEIRIAAGG